MNENEASEGFVYVWRVPIHIPVVASNDSSRTENFFIVKVGQTCTERLLIRLYDEHLAWSKLLKYSNKGTDIRVPYGKSLDLRDFHEFGLKDLMTKNKYKYLQWDDLGCILHRSPKSSATLDDTEVLLRALLGFPLGCRFLEIARVSYNKLSRERRKAITRLTGEIKKSQLAPTEYILVPESRFMVLQNLYMDEDLKKKLLGDVSLKFLVKGLIAAKEFACETLNDCEVNLSHVLKFPGDVAPIAYHALAYPVLKSVALNKGSDTNINVAIEEQSGSNPIQQSPKEKKKKKEGIDPKLQSVQKL